MASGSILHQSGLERCFGAREGGTMLFISQVLAGFTVLAQTPAGAVANIFCL